MVVEPNVSSIHFSVSSPQSIVHNLRFTVSSAQLALLLVAVVHYSCTDM